MGLDEIQNWDELDNAIARLREEPGVFGSPEERDTLLGAVQGAIAHEADTTKKLKMASDVAGIIKTGGAGVLGALRAYFPWLSAIV